MLLMLPLDARLWVERLKESPLLTMPLEVVLKDRTRQSPLPPPAPSFIQSGAGRGRKAGVLGRELVRGLCAASMSKESLGRGRFLKEEDLEWEEEPDSRRGDTLTNFSSGTRSPSTRMSIMMVVMTAVVDPL